MAGSSPFELAFDPALDRNVLFHIITEDRVPLQPGRWELHEDDRGRAYIQPETGDSLWCQDLLPHCTTFVESKGEFFVVDSLGKYLSLREFQQKHVGLDIPILLAGRSTPFVSKAFVLDHSVGGSRLLWSLNALHEGLLPKTSLTTSKWYQSWWHWWLKMLAALHVPRPDVHLRKPQEHGHRLQGEVPDPLRFLQVATVTTLALLVLLTRWGNDSKSAATKDRVAQESWSIFLDGLLAKVFENKVHSIPIFLDTSALIRPPLPVQGSNMVSLTINFGLVDFRPLCAGAAGADVKESLNRLGPMGDLSKVPLPLLCRVLERGGRKCAWLWAQVVYQLSEAIEGELARPTEPPATPALADEQADLDTFSTRWHRQRVGRFKKFSLQLMSKLSQESNLKAMLLKYYFCLRKHFHQEKVMHASFDASRVGCLNRMLGYITNSSGVGAWLPPQALKDLQTKATLALDLHDEEGMQTAKADWELMAKQFWIAANDADDQVKYKKVARTKTFQWLSATEWMLKIGTSKGWSQFLVPEEAKHEPSSWPSLTLSIDQGGDGWSAAHYLLSEGYNLWLLPDTSHRAWNDMQLALQDAEVYQVCLLTQIVMNLDHGPWNGAKWFQELQAGAAEYMKVSNECCPIFEKLVENILQDKGATMSMDFDAKKVFSDIPKATETKFERVGMCRWFQYCTSVHKFCSMWTERFIIILYICLSMGMFKQASISELVTINMKPTTESEDIGKSTTAHDREVVQKLRSSCKNTMAFACVLLSDRKLWQVNKIIAHISKPLQAWHSQQNKQNRSGDDSVAWWKTQAGDKGLGHINEVLNMANSTNLLSDIGCAIPGESVNLDGLKHDDPFIEKQDELVSIIGELTVAVAKRRLRSMIMFDFWPGRFAALLDPSEAPKVLNEMEEFDLLWNSIQDKKGPWWDKVRTRSPMQHSHTKQLFLLAKQTHFKDPTVLADIIQKQLGGITQTKSIEDGIREERVGEVSKSFNKTMSGTRVWGELIVKRPDNKKHRFTELPFQNQVVPRGVKTKSVSGFFSPKASETPKAFKNIISAGKAPYHSPGALFTSVPCEDAALLKHCAKSDSLDLIPNHWFALLANTKNLLISCPSVLDGQWCLSLGTIGGSAILGLPVVKSTLGKAVFYYIAPLHEYIHIPILNEKTTKAMTVCWKSPASLRVQCGRWVPEKLVCMQATSKPDSLEKVAAWNAFWKMGKASLRQLAKYKSIDIGKDPTIADMIIKLAVGILGKLNDKQKLDILRHRLLMNNDLTDFLLSSEAKDMLHDDDHEALDKTLESSASDQTVHAEVILSVKKLAAVVHPKAAKGSSSSSAAPAKAKRVYPPKVETTSTMSQDDVNKFLPTGCRMYVDRLDSTWRMQAFGGKWYGRSMNLYGYEEAAKILIREAWRVAIEQGHEPSCPFAEFGL